jgi:hypothetical protein
MLPTFSVTSVGSAPGASHRARCLGPYLPLRHTVDPSTIIEGAVR